MEDVAQAGGEGARWFQLYVHRDRGLTRALVEANRARFDISSEKGKGTIVDIVFPTNRVLSE